MKKIFFLLFVLVFLQGCGPTASIVSSGITLAQGGNASKTLMTSGSSLIIKDKTGKEPLEHVTDKINSEKRQCTVSHSAELNQIFFTTLDEFDCEKDFLSQANLHYLK